MFAGEGVENGLVGLCLRLNARLGVMTEEPKFGAQQAHTFGVEARSLLSGFAVAHVCVKLHPGAVGEHAFTVEVGDRFAVGVLLGGLTVGIGRFGVHYAFVRIHVYDGAVGDFGHALSRHNRGKAQPACQDRGVRLRAAVGGDQGDHFLRV